MILDLYRTPSTALSTLGRLGVNGRFECWTLEDVVRDSKIPGETAIPPGRYRVIVNFSPKFGRRLPLLQNVPNYTAIRIHAGNTARDTAGCILMGEIKGVDAVYHSQAALDALQSKILAAIDRDEDVWMEIHAALPVQQTIPA